MESNGSVKKRYYALKRYSLRELEEIYDESRYLLKPKLDKIKKEIGKKEGYFYEIDQVEKIFQLIRLPADVEIIK